jgi:hypothetical protein
MLEKEEVLEIREPIKVYFSDRFKDSSICAYGYVLDVIERDSDSFHGCDVTPIYRVYDKTSHSIVALEKEDLFYSFEECKNYMIQIYKETVEKELMLLESMEDPSKKTKL